MRRVHQDRATRIKSETVEATSGQKTALARFMGRHHENDLFVFPRFGEEGAKACQHRYDKTESSRERSLRCRDNLMKRTGNETAIRQVAIKCGKAERQPGMEGLSPAWMRREQKPQFGQSGRSAVGWGYRQK